MSKIDTLIESKPSQDVPDTGSLGGRNSDSIQVNPGHTEIELLAQEMGQAYKKLVEYYQEKMGLSPAEADAKARQPFKSLSLRSVDVEDVSWWRLATEAGKDPEAALAFWMRLKAIATSHFATGHRTASASSYDDTPWRRAQFLAVRDLMIEEWQPRGASELILIDSMVQAYTAQLFWMEEFHRRSTAEVKQQSEPGWFPPRATVAEAIDQAAAMVDRFNKMYMRALRALRDLRRHSGSIHIQQAGQVNVGQQQVIQQSITRDKESGTADKGSTSDKLQLIHSINGAAP